MAAIDDYQFRVSWSEEDEVYVAYAAEFPSFKTDGSTRGEALDNLQAALSEALDNLERQGESLPIPYSKREFKGNISLRLPPETHRLLAERAYDEGISLNAFLTSVIEKNLYESRIMDTVARLRFVAEEIESQYKM